MQANGGAKAFRDDNKKLSDLDNMIVNAAPGAKAESSWAYREMSQDMFEGPNAAADKNWDTFSRKFEAQKDQIIEEISHAVERINDRVIEGPKSGVRERIRDQVRFCMPLGLSYDRYVLFLQAIYDTWVNMVDMMQSSFRPGRIYATDKILV